MVGQTAEAVRQLQTCLFQQFEQSPIHLSLENKYFTSSVTLASMDQISDSSKNYKEDGVILVVNATKNFESQCQSLHTTLLEACPDVGDLLRLCCVIGASSSLSEEEYSQRILWCLDHGYEYVPGVDLTKTEVGHDDRDKEGFARVVEALESTVWSSAVMKKKTAANATAATTSNHGETTTSRTKPEDTIAATSEETKTSQNDTTSSSYEPPSLSPFQLPPQPEEEDDEESRSLQQLESVMKEATRIRDMSMKGELTDDERKARAADAAQLLMGLMLDDDDDDEEDSSSQE